MLRSCLRLVTSQWDFTCSDNVLQDDGLSMTAACIHKSLHQQAIKSIPHRNLIPKIDLLFMEKRHAD